MIHGERVRLRRVEREDLARFAAWLNDPEVRRHLALVYPMGMANEEAWFEAQLKAEPAVQPYAIDVRALSTVHSRAPAARKASSSRSPRNQSAARGSRDAPPPPAAAGPDPAWTHVGGAGFHSVDWPSRCAELGIVLGSRDSWGQGYGTDATRALVGWGFRELNLNRVWLRVFEDNARGIRCYEKVGFRLEGRLRQDRFREGRYLDTLVMGVLRDEFQDPGPA